MFSTIKDFFYEITKQKIPLGITFVLLIIDFKVSKEQINGLLKIFFSEATINELENFISIAFDISYYAVIISTLSCVVLGLIGWILGKIIDSSKLSFFDLRPFEIIAFCFKTRIDRYVVTSTSCFVILYIIQHILQKVELQASWGRPGLELFILICTALIWIITFTDEVKYDTRIT